MDRYHVVRMLSPRRVTIWRLATILTILFSTICLTSTSAFAQDGIDPNGRDTEEDAIIAAPPNEEDTATQSDNQGLPDWVEPAADVVVDLLDLFGVDDVDKIAQLVNSGLNLADIIVGGDGISSTSPGEGTSPETPWPENGTPPSMEPATGPNTTPPQTIGN